MATLTHAAQIVMSEGEDDTQMEKAPEVEEMSAKANEDLARLCGGEEMAERVKKLWEDLMEKKRLDVSKQRLSDTEVGMLLKGLYSMARTTGFQTERMKPLPITELDFSGNELTAKGIDEVVQFARTAGANATLVDLSDNRLNDAASNELARLVKNYKCAPSPRHHPATTTPLGRRTAGSHLASRPATDDCAPLHTPRTLPLPAVARSSFASQKLLGELLLNGNEIGKTGATKLIQYAAYHPHTPASYHPSPRLPTTPPTTHPLALAPGTRIGSGTVTRTRRSRLPR